MAKHVIYSHSMEPLTVLDLSERAVRELMNYGYCKYATFEELPADYNNVHVTCNYVTITSQLFMTDGGKCMILFTKDVDKVKSLKSTLLPGQEQQYRRVIR